MGRTRVYVSGLQAAQSALLTSVLQGHGFEVVPVEPVPPPDALGVEADPGLTKRQLEILATIQRRGSTMAAADELRLSVRTVNAHLDHIYRRVGLRNRLAVLCWACRRGLLPTGQ